MRRTLPPLFTAVQMAVLTLLVGSSVLSAQGSRTRDRTPPTAPTNLVVTATTEHSVSLAWGPSTDNSGSFNYLICCAGTTVTVSQTVTSHTLDGLQPGKTYVFRVYAKDAAGNLSKSSNPVTVTLPGELAAPTKPVVTLLDVGPTHAIALMVVHRRRPDDLVFDLHRWPAHQHAEFENCDLYLRRRSGAYGMCAAESRDDVYLHRSCSGR